MCHDFDLCNACHSRRQELHDSSHEFCEVPLGESAFPFCFPGKGFGKVFGDLKGKGKGWWKGKGKGLFKGKGKGKGWGPWMRWHGEEHREPEAEEPSSSSSDSESSSSSSCSHRHKRHQRRACAGEWSTEKAVWKQQKQEAKKDYRAQMRAAKEQMKALEQEHKQRMRVLKQQHKAWKQDQKAQKRSMKKGKRCSGGFVYDGLGFSPAAGTAAAAAAAPMPEPSAPLLQAASASPLEVLAEMGFENIELNAQLLEAHGGSVQKVIEVLAGFGSNAM